MSATGEDAVNAINRVFGTHRGSRAAHARGSVCRGFFTATSEAAKLTVAEHMQGEAVEVTVRFSNASGDPGIRDSDPDARGMAVKIRLPSGKTTDIVAVTLPCFFVATRDDFMKLNHALRRNRKGRRSLLALPRLVRFYLGHKEARPAIRAVLRPKPVPSYANCRFNALHSFKWTGPSGTHFVRYSWRPDAGEETISSKDAKSRPHDYLQEDLADRLGREPVKPIRFTLQLQIASKEDYDRGRVCNPTAIWPSDRFVDVGILELNGLAEGNPNPDDPLLFDPMRLTEGIEAPVLENGIEPVRDEILHFRPEAYDVSFHRRTGDTEGVRS